MLTVIIRDNGIGRKRAATLKSKSVEKYKSMGLQITAQRMWLYHWEERRSRRIYSKLRIFMTRMAMRRVRR